MQTKREKGHILLLALALRLCDLGGCQLNSLDPRFLMNKMRKPTFRDHCRNETM